MGEIGWEGARYGSKHKTTIGHETRARYPVASTAIFMLRYQIGCGWPTLRRWRPGVGSLTWPSSSMRSGAGSWAGGASTSMTAALVSRRSRARLLHPRPSIFLIGRFRHMSWDASGRLGRIPRMARPSRGRSLAGAGCLQRLSTISPHPRAKVGRVWRASTSRD